MRRLSALISFGLILFAMSGWTNGQGMMNYTVNINFDRGNVSPTGGKIFTDYTEQGFRFFGDFAISGGFESNPGFPRNGGPYAYAFFDSFVSIMPVNGVPFYLVSADLAEFSTLYAQPRTVEFVGYRADGSVVTIRFTTDGIIDGAGPLADFETFHFDASWSYLLRVDVPSTTYSMDNLVLGIPEPSAPVLWLLGAAALWGFRPSRPRPPQGSGSGKNWR